MLLVDLEFSVEMAEYERFLVGLIEYCTPKVFNLNSFDEQITEKAGSLCES